MAAKRPVRALVIGASETTVLLHLPVLARLKDEGRVVLAEVCDLDPERAKAAQSRFGFLTASGDAVAAIENPDVNAAYIFGGAQLHYELGLMALAHGKHLFVEKPVAPSYAQACELAHAAQARGLVAVGGHNRRFYRSLAEIRARAGKAGWRFAEAVFHKPELGRPAPFGTRTWLSANGVHALDALVFMMGGLPDQMTALAEGSGSEPSAFSAVMRWPDGGQGVFLCDNDAGARREDYAFHGLGETWRATEAGLVIEKDGGSAKLDLPLAGDGFAAEHLAFLEAISSDEAPPHSLAAIAPSLFLAELIERGFNGSVRLPPLPIGARRETPSRSTSILVVKPARLQTALAKLLPHHRLVSLEEIEAAPGSRPDVAAAILGPGSAPLSAEVLDKLPALSVAGVAALSLVRYEPEALLARGIALVNASSAYADSVAEFALGLAILGRRRAFASHEVMRRGGWGTVVEADGLKGVALRAARRLRPAAAALGLLPLARRARPLLGVADARAGQARDLRGASVGLIGWGANARAFALRLTAAGASVRVWSEHAADRDIRDAGAAPASLGEALAADIVSLHRGLTPTTRHFLGAAELARLRPGSVLINVARAGLIEPSALLERLRKGDVYACLDTFAAEPPPASDPLRKLPNVFLTSHIAGGSPDMQAAAAEEVVGKVRAHLHGRPVEAVSRERLAVMT